MLEPSDNWEAKNLPKAFELSENFDTPSCSDHDPGISPKPSYEAGRFSPVAGQEVRHAPGQCPQAPSGVENDGRGPFAETFPENRTSGEKKVGIITSGISYEYAKEVMPEASFLKLGMVYPCLGR
jgi:indolepyruvate ferredoxin oxidoreductase alpha subunit